MLDVATEVRWPSPNFVPKTVPVSAVERPVRFFETGQISGDRRNETVDRVLGLTYLVAVAADGASLVDESPQRRRGSPALGL